MLLLCYYLVFISSLSVSQLCVSIDYLKVLMDDIQNVLDRMFWTECFGMSSRGLYVHLDFVARTGELL